MTYKIVNKGKVDDAFILEAEQNRYHPVREYLDGLVWDGVKRVETLLVDYLGAENTEYVRTVTRKFLAAAVARVERPGVKFDYMLVTSGPQGIGKTSLPQILAGKWFSNSLEGVSGKDAYESLQGTWIMEMGEMNATKKADIEATKHFISKTEDIFRVAYGHYKSYFKRQCVFWGTSNDSEFLRDRTGNRRFWPVDVGVNTPEKSVWDDLTNEVRDQIWAEAKFLYDNGEKLYLTASEEQLAVEQQKLHTEVNALEGMIQEFVDIPITGDWYERSADDRRRYIQDFGEDELAPEGSVRREKVSVMEVWNELLKGDPRNLIPVKAAEIRNILTNMDGWRKANTNKGQSSFGKDYGRQVAYLRLLPGS
ncbi:VapE domain-containing protein [Secundilactobacillus kimchicus]